MNRQLCVKCADIPQDILILTCNHGLCTYCAYQLCQNHQFICCPKCSIFTHFEIKSNNNYSKIKPIDLTIVNETEQKQKDPLFQQKQNPKQNHKKSIFSETDKFLCKQHSQFELMYLCKDCNNIFICPQCIIHGIHHNHQVQTIKKQFINVQQQLTLKMANINITVKDIYKSAQNRKNQLKNKINHVHQLKQQAIAKYQIIKEQLAKEETQIVQNCQALIYGFNKELNEIDKNIEKDHSFMEKETKLITEIINPKQNVTTKQLEITTIQSYFKYLNFAKKNTKRVQTWLGETHEKTESFNDQNLVQLSDRVQAIQDKLMHSQESNCISQSESRKREKEIAKIQKTETFLNKTKEIKKCNTLKTRVEGQNKQNSILLTANNNGNLSSKKGLKKIKKNCQKESLCNNFFVF